MIMCLGGGGENSLQKGGKENYCNFQIYQSRHVTDSFRTLTQNSYGDSLRRDKAGCPPSSFPREENDKMKSGHV